MFRKTCFATALALGLAFSSQSGAQTDEERAGARAAANQGATAFEAGEYQKAIDYFSRAEKLVHAPPHLLYIARSQEKLGHLVKAQEAYIKIKRERFDADAPVAFKQAQQTAIKELEALEPRIPYLTVMVQGGEATVTMDGKPVPDALVGVPRPVDPGEHTFEATGEGLKSDPVTVTVAEGERSDVTLELKPAPGATAGAAGGGEGTGPGEGGEGTGFEASTADTGGMSTMKLAGYGALGVGAVGTIVGVVFLLQKGSKESEADDLFNSCNPRGCTPSEVAEVESIDSDASSAGTLSTVGFVVGVVGIGTGITLLILDSKKESAALELRHGDVAVQPWVGYRSAGFVGTF